MPEFRTIRQTAATGLYPEHAIRALVKRGQCPGIYSASRFLVNVPALAELLERKSLEAVKVEATK